MIVSLEEAKQFLKIDADDEDTLITSFINTAEELSQDILRLPFSEFTEVPETVKQAVLYAVGNMYEQRENSNMKAVIDVMTRLLFAFRKDVW